MIEYISRERVHAFYESVIAQHIHTEEGLEKPVGTDCIELMDKAFRVGARALDLGYGYGDYSIALARRGYQTTAVDYVSPETFDSRVEGLGLTNRIRVIHEDINDFLPKERYNFVVAKDVLHFLPKAKVSEQLGLLAARPLVGAVHYYKVFADIERCTDDGQPLRIVNEADFTVSEFRELFIDTYRHWRVTLSEENYREAARSGRGDYFTATRIRAIAEYDV